MEESIRLLAESIKERLENVPDENVYIMMTPKQAKRLLDAIMLSGLRSAGERPSGHHAHAGAAANDLEVRSIRR